MLSSCTILDHETLKLQKKKTLGKGGPKWCADKKINMFKCLS